MSRSGETFMKIIGAILGLLLSSLSSFSASYSGAGDWKSNHGDSGSYPVEVTIEPGENNTLTINQTLSFNNEVLNFSVVLQKIDENFYDVLNAQGEHIGNGYCWPLQEEETIICHSVSHEYGYVVESTIKHTANAIYRIGSKTSQENDEKIIWKDVVLLQNNI